MLLINAQTLKAAFLHFYLKHEATYDNYELREVLNFVIFSC